jgi:ferric-dicitrate binding protein FerR (iron transport regulator)
MNLKEAQHFVAQFVTGDYTPEEYATFLQWLRGASLEELNAIADEHEALHENWSLPPVAPSPEWVAMLEGKLDKAGVDEVVEVTPVRRIGAGGFTHRKAWIAAASVIVLLTAGAVLYKNQHEESNIQGKTKSQAAVAPVFSQSVVNPRGGNPMEATLPDGSKVWLNAASTLKYTADFGSHERLVALSGEAFFEVAQNSNKPFRVLIKDAEVDVLGTHFNIMAYDDEPVSRTTLIDGAVKVGSGSQEKTLHPGQQAEIAYSSPGVESRFTVISEVDAGIVLKWRSGGYKFNNADVRTVMRAVSRYYNVRVIYGQDLPEKSISAGFRRQDSLSHVLKILEGFFNLHFINDGNIVTVTR